MGMGHSHLRAEVADKIGTFGALDDGSRSCIDIFRSPWKRRCDTDLHDLYRQTPFCPASCKLKEEHKSIRPAGIDAEVKEAKLFPQCLDKYGVQTPSLWCFNPCACSASHRHPDPANGVTEVSGLNESFDGLSI